jgi:hypothetical protein
MNEPKRWLDDDGALDDDARRALRAGFAAPVPHGARNVVWRELRNKLPLGIASAALGVTAVKAAGAASLVKMGLTGIVLGSVVAVAAVGGERLLTPPTETKRPPSAVRRLPAPTPAPVAPRASNEPAPTLDPTPELPQPPPPRERPRIPQGGPELPAPSVESKAPAPAPPRSVASFPVPTPPAVTNIDAGAATLESRRVADARTHLRTGSAAHALGILDGVRRDFPNGVLTQEREALTIEALLALGEYSHARLLATSFLARYPGSPHAEAARRALK